jgi:16S rRNA (guanine966-N2)-methyltransferase
MRIVGGSLGGRVLRAPRGARTRPTSEKVRQAVIHILEGRLGSLEGAHVLDLFAGSGALGIEALSRGAAHATFVDSAAPAVAAIRENLAALGLTARAAVLALDALTAARLAPAGGAPWRAVFVDPPYATGAAAPRAREAALPHGPLSLAARAALAIPPASLAPGAVIVIEHDRRGALPDALGSLLRTDQRRYGDTVVTFFEAPP